MGKWCWSWLWSWSWCWNWCWNWCWSRVDWKWVWGWQGHSAGREDGVALAPQLGQSDLVEVGCLGVGDRRWVDGQVVGCHSVATRVGDVVSAHYLALGVNVAEAADFVSVSVLDCVVGLSWL